jgi:hypothetical protein
MYGTVKTMDSHMMCEYVVVLDIRGTTTPKPMEPLPTSTTGSANKEATMGGITSRAHNIEEVIRTSTQFTIGMNLP